MAAQAREWERACVLNPLSGPEVQKMSDADLTGLVTNGEGKMPAYKGKLSDDQISAVVKYVKTLK